MEDDHIKYCLNNKIYVFSVPLSENKKIFYGSL